MYELLVQCLSQTMLISIFDKSNYHIKLRLVINDYIVLQYIPMSVLYGVFLYMGVTSLNGVQVRLS